MATRLPEHRISSSQDDLYVAGAIPTRSPGVRSCDSVSAIRIGSRLPIDFSRRRRRYSRRASSWPTAARFAISGPARARVLWAVSSTGTPTPSLIDAPGRPLGCSLHRGVVYISRHVPLQRIERSLRPAWWEVLGTPSRKRRGPRVVSPTQIIRPTTSGSSSRTTPAPDRPDPGTLGRIIAYSYDAAALGLGHRRRGGITLTRLTASTGC